MMFCVGGRHTHPRKTKKLFALDMPAKRFIFGILACNDARQMPNLQFNTTQISRFLVARRVLKRLLQTWLPYQGKAQSAPQQLRPT